MIEDNGFRSKFVDRFFINDILKSLDFIYFSMENIRYLYFIVFLCFYIYG